MAEKIIGVIPARFGSTRFEGKPLVKILNKPLLQWVIEAAKRARSLHHLLVATDDVRIKNLAEALDVEAVMTDPNLSCGTDRVWAAVKDRDCQYVLNVQGDEPLLTGEVIDTLALALNDEVPMATLARPIKTLEELHNPSVAKIALNQRGEALYFSRAAIPFPRNGNLCGHLKHIGQYGFQKAFLEKFCNAGPVDLENVEGLEQLRALWLGVRIKVVLTDYESWGVDTPEDVVRVEGILKGRL